MTDTKPADAASTGPTLEAREAIAELGQTPAIMVTCSWEGCGKQTVTTQPDAVRAIASGREAIGPCMACGRPLIAKQPKRSPLIIPNEGANRQQRRSGLILPGVPR